MLVKSSLLFAGLVMGHSVRSEELNCGAPAPSDEQMEAMRRFADQEANALKDGLSSQAVINVDVWLHSVSADESGLSDDATLQGQFDTLADSFAPNDVHLNYAGSTRTVNADWADKGNGQDMQMKQELRRGDYRTMNIYIIDVLPNASGTCTYPTDAPEGSDNFIRDGCTLAKKAIGPIAIHEAGHWFGLIHTFDGDDCDGPGDLVDDTPAQSGPSSGCPVGRDSCPNHPGEDPITNIMDYSSP